MVIGYLIGMLLSFPVSLYGYYRLSMAYTGTEGRKINVIATAFYILMMLVLWPIAVMIMPFLAFRTWLGRLGKVLCKEEM